MCWPGIVDRWRLEQLAPGLSGQGNVVAVMDDAVEDRVRDGAFAKHIVPGSHRQL